MCVKMGHEKKNENRWVFFESHVPTLIPVFTMHIARRSGGDERGQQLVRGDGRTAIPSPRALSRQEGQNGVVARRTNARAASKFNARGEETQAHVKSRQHNSHRAHEGKGAGRGGKKHKHSARTACAAREMRRRAKGERYENVKLREKRK